MQVNQLNIADYIQKDNKIEGQGVAGTGAASKAKETNGQTGELRSVSVQNPTYGKSLWSDDNTNSLAGELAGSTDAEQRKNDMIVASNTTTESDYEQMQKNGYSPMDMDKDEFVNVADKIKVQLAKAGADVSQMGGLSEDTIASVTGSEMQAIAMASEVQPLTSAGIQYMMTNELEPTIENLYKASYAEGKTQEMNNSATTNIDEGVNVTIANTNQQVDISGMEDQIAKVIQDAGLEVNDETMKQSQWLIEQQIPLTSENLTYYNELAQFTADFKPEEIQNKIADAVQEGRQPQEAYLIPGYSMHDQAQMITDVVANATELDVNALIDQNKVVNVANIAEEQGVNITGGLQEEPVNSVVSNDNTVADTSNQATDSAEITAYRQLEELRLMMTTQANYTLMKQGISIDTESLQQLIEQLKMLEASLQEGMPSNLIALQQQAYASGDSEAIQAYSMKNVETYLTFAKQVVEIQSIPADVLGQVTAESTVSEVYEAGTISKDTYEKANATYEALMTAPRRDMGDSIQKAFQNVDDILDDLGLEATEANQRAVRILGYNSMDITAENISSVKAADEQVQRLFYNMTPAVVTEMMKENINPLDMSIDELNTVAEGIKETTGSTSSEEKFSKYLYRLEQNNDITEEERESFIGVYRLIHQVEATDGAAIGSLLQQGADITMRNLMTAVRNEKHSNREYGIDDSFGALDRYEPEKLSITQQIEVAYQSDCIKDAGEMITPEKMSAFENEDSYMNLTPEGLADAFRQMEGQTQTSAYTQEEIANIQQAEANSEAAYAKNVSEQVKEAVTVEDAVYEILEQYDIPTTPSSLAAMSEWMGNKNSLYKKLLEPNADATDEDDSSVDINLDLIKEQLIEEFGEAIKTPKEMAEAQRKLEEVAENAMKNFMIEQDVTSIDVRGMKLIKTQISSLGQVADKQETYNIPIMVADELGNMTLKIVRGEDQKGLADIAFDTESTGVVTASFRYENGMVDGEITSERADTRELLADHMGLIAQNISEGSGYGVSLKFAMDENANTDDILTNTDYGYKEVQASVTAEIQENDEQKILTTTLYGIAKSFVDTLGEIA